MPLVWRAKKHLQLYEPIIFNECVLYPHGSTSLKWALVMCANYVMVEGTTIRASLEYYCKVGVLRQSLGSLWTRMGPTYTDHNNFFSPNERGHLKAEWSRHIPFPLHIEVCIHSSHNQGVAVSKTNILQYDVALTKCRPRRLVNQMIPMEQTWTAIHCLNSMGNSVEEF